MSIFFLDYLDFRLFERGHLDTMDTIEDKVAVVTGAASGIGRALACRFGAEGAKVVLADVEVEALEKAAAEVEGAGAEVLAVPTDVSDRAAVDARVNQFARQ